jgi:hypothetical protein
MRILPARVADKTETSYMVRAPTFLGRIESLVLQLLIPGIRSTVDNF